MRASALPLIVASMLIAGAPAVFAADGDAAPGGDRMFGVLPNYNTVDTGSTTRQTTRDSFKIASLGTFDPVVYPFLAVTTAVGIGSSDESYSSRYAVAFADNTIGNFMTTALVPSLTNQDSRYYRRGEGSVFNRLAYAASRSLVTRTRSGAPTFNISEVAGTAAAAGLSNIYYS